jgi:SAM-dependent methyltransferase
VDGRVASGALPREVADQARYHHDLFAALYRWDEVWEVAVDIAEASNAPRLHLDQLGHFGAPGVELVAERLLAASEDPPSRVVELGCGFGGVLRHMRSLLAARGAEPALIGVDFVPDHCAVAEKIGRSLGDTAPTILTADVRELPLRSMSVDAVFACGSASHFSNMDTVLAEASRVLRPRGVLALTEEVSLRPAGGAKVGARFLRHHPAEVFPSASPAERRAEIDGAGLDVEAFESLTGWALPLLRQRVRALRFLGPCATRMFGAEAAQRLAETLESAADEYERESIQPSLIVARRPSLGAA